MKHEGRGLQLPSPCRSFTISNHGVESNLEDDFWSCFLFRKASCTYVSARKLLILGPEMAAPISWATGIFAFVLQENLHAHRCPRFGGGGGVILGGGGGEVNFFIFMGAGNFLIFGRSVFGSGRKTHPKSRNTPKIVFTQTYSRSSSELLPSSLWHESETQQKLLRTKCSDELFILVTFCFRMDFPPLTIWTSHTSFVQQGFQKLLAMDFRSFELRPC